MTQSITKRPRAISVIGWFCIVVGCCGTFVALCHIWNGTPIPPSDADKQRGYDNLCYTWVLWDKDFNSVCSIAELIAGVYLLKLRNWARMTIEVVCWLEILVVPVGTMVAIVWSVYHNPLALQSLADLSAWPMITVLAFLVVLCATRAAVNGAIIYYLRSKQVGDAFASPQRVTP